MPLLMPSMLLSMMPLKMLMPHQMPPTIRKLKVKLAIRLSQMRISLPALMVLLLKPTKMEKSRKRILKKTSPSLTTTDLLPSKTLSARKEESVPIFMTILS